MSSFIINNIYIRSLRSISVSLSTFYSKASLQICKVYRFNKFTKICKYLLTSVSFAVGQLPPMFFICFIISFLWSRNFLHWNIKRSAVCSSSSHRHIALSVSPNLYRCDLSYQCPVNIVVNSGNKGIFCHSTCFGLLEVIFRVWLKRIKCTINCALKWRDLVCIRWLIQYIKI